jgi:hypothetical protein
MAKDHQLHAGRRRWPASIAILLGLALVCTSVVVPRTSAAAPAHASQQGAPTAAEASKHEAPGESGEYASEYGAGPAANGGDDSAYFPAPPADLRAAARQSPPASGESETRAIDTAVLGPEHAAEHAAVRRAERKWARLGHQPHIRNSKDALSSRGAAPLANAGTEAPPSEVGQWTEAPFNLPTFAINSTVLPTGKVLFWGRPPDPLGADPRANVGQAALWSPWLGTGPDAFQDVAPPVIDPDGPGGQPPAPAPIFCSGLSQLPDGEVVVAGGTLVYANTSAEDAYTYYAGLSTVFTFDPFSETWTQQPNMAHGRWYPSQTLLPDGRTIFTGGLNEDPPGGVMNKTLEVFNPPAVPGAMGSVEQEPSADRALGLYPRTFSVGDNLLVAGPQKNRVAILDTTNFTWQSGLPHMSRTRTHDTAVRAPGGTGASDTFTEIGGYSTSEGDGDGGDITSGGGGGEFYPATDTSETMNVDAKKPTWMPDAPLNVARANANTVLLPDGSMATVGGGSGYNSGDGGGYVTYADGRARQVELYDPATNSWRLGPAQQEDRAYHSTGVLLPDGRVFSAGDDLHPLAPDGGRSQTDTAEIYSPPYLFTGPRPQIDSAPQQIRWGDAFGVASTSPDVERAVLMAPGATTHGFDMHQRYVKLQVLDTVDGKGVDVLAPPSSSAAPPGYYMLFLINKQGVPSVASWVKVDAQAPDQPLIGSPPAGDFNGDGLPDLAIAASGEAVGSADGAGVVHVVYGSASGSEADNQTWSESDLGGGQAADSGEGFGAAVAVGDFNVDGFADLAVGAPGKDAGTVDVIYGSPNGLVAAGSQAWDQNAIGGGEGDAAGDRLGATLAAGDLNGDGSDDLAIGVPGANVDTASAAGAVDIIYGSGDGLTSTGNQLWSQNASGVLDAAEAGDSFGTALASGDLNGDGHADLAIGVPGESIKTTAGAGAVNVIYGSGSGLSSTGNQLWSQNASGVLDAAETGDSFGAALASGDLNGDGHADLAIGVPGESIKTTAGAGAVNVIYGSGSGLSSTGNQLWSQNRSGVLDAAEAGDSFGTALASGDLNGDGSNDLAIGVPGESVKTTAGAGAVNIIYGSGSGLTSTGNQLWSQDSVNVSDVAEAGDSFGAALASSDLDRDGHADLAVGVPAESVGPGAGAGALNLIYGSDSGLASPGNRLWSEDSLGQTAPGDQFGAALGAVAP